MKASELKQIIKEEISKALAENQIKEEDKMAGMLNRLDKNKPLKVDDITTIKSGKYAGKKVKIVADLGGGSYGLEFVEKTLDEATVKLGSDKTFILKSDKRGVQLTKVDPNSGFQVHSEMYILTNEIPDVIDFLSKHK